MIYLSKPAIVSSAGLNAKQSFEAILSGHRFLSKCDEFGDKSYILGKIKEPLATFSKDTPKYFKTRTNSILLTALLELSPLILKLKQKSDKIGVIIGTTTSGTQENFRFFKELGFSGEFNKDEFSLKEIALSNPASFVSHFFGLSGISFCISTACTSGAKAIMQAARAIEAGICDYVICGGVDSLSLLTIKGFDSLSILSEGYSNPFAKHRDGINIGEAAGIFVLAKHELDSDICLAGYASNCDAFHTTQPDFSAIWQSKVIDDALKMANLKSVDYINLHATGTQANDKMEALAIKNTSKDTPVSGIKASIGHTLGAAGAVEFGVCAMALELGILPPHVMSGKYDDEIDMVNLVTKSIRLNLKSAMSLSFAFGGDNAALIAKKEAR